MNRRTMFARMMQRPCAALLMVLPACTEGTGAGNWFAPQGEPWSILCIECTDFDHQPRSADIADSLRRTEGIRPQDVKVVHSANASSVYYGTYYRRIDTATNHLTTPPQLESDLAVILSLATPQSVRFFPTARMAPAPVPDVGNPEWSLENASGAYTLLVAIFQNTPEFYERKEAAAQYAEYLRDGGFEAYYHHGSVTSEVTVGLFGEDALVRMRHEEVGGVVLDQLSPAVRTLQAQEDFRYELWNLGKRYEIVGGKRAAIASRLVRIDEFQGERP